MPKGRGGRAGRAGAEGAKWYFVPILLDSFSFQDSEAGTLFGPVTILPLVRHQTTKAGADIDQGRGRAIILLSAKEVN